MDIEVQRFEYGSNFTIGRFYIDGVKQCYTLEDVVRAPGVKVKAMTAIPVGTYKLILDWSPKYNRDMLHVLDVPMFDGIRIHSGNDSEDTEGCLLVGEDWAGGNWISGSKKAYNKIFPLIESALAKKEEVFITIIDTR